MSGTLSGMNIANRRRAMIGVGALFQFAAATIFMVAFGFPKVMIAIFGVMIAVGAVFSMWVKSRPFAPPAAQRPLSHATLFRILSLGIALCSVVFFAIVLFGFVIFINNWNYWHRYEGQPYHRSDFVVTNTYYQRGYKGAVDIYARGTVEGQREWMSLQPYLHTRPRNQSELDERAPAGTSIPIYLFPQMKGRSRVRVYDVTPAAEAYHRTAINALNRSLEGLGLTGILIFVLSRCRKMCFAETDSAVQALTASQGR
jgi:hypothetical protein